MENCHPEGWLFSKYHSGFEVILKYHEVNEYHSCFEVIFQISFYEYRTLIRRGGYFLTLKAGKPRRSRTMSYFFSNHLSSAISWNLFIYFEVVVYETLFLSLVYLLSYIPVFWVVKYPLKIICCELFIPHIVVVSLSIYFKQIVNYSG